MVLLWKTLQKHSQNTVFALENHVWEDSVSNFSPAAPTMIEEPLSSLIYTIDCDLVWYCLYFQRSLCTFVSEERRRREIFSTFRWF